MDRKRIKYIILSLAIGFMFLTSYAVFFNQGGNTLQGQNQTNHTTQAAGGIYAFAFANATIVGYNKSLSINLTCRNSTELTSLSYVINTQLAALEKNNSIATYYQIQNQFVIETGILNSTRLYDYFLISTNATSRSCLAFYSQAKATLPLQVSMHVGAQTYPIQIPTKFGSFQIPLALTNQTANTIKVRINALLSSNGSINSMSVVKAVQ